MSEATQPVSSRSRAKPMSGPSASAFEFPKFEMPNFEMPKMEVPAAFREFAEKGVSQAKETYEKMKAAAEEATDDVDEARNVWVAGRGCSVGRGAANAVLVPQGKACTHRRARTVSR